MRRLFFLAGVLGWFAVALQYLLMLAAAPGKGLPVPLATLNFFSYFTILSNILAAAALTIPPLAPRTAAGRFFARAPVITGITVCVVIVGLVYNTVLRGLWSPRGAQLLADDLLHVAMPVVFAAFWWIVVPGGTWSWRALGRGALFPLLYLGVSLARGAADGWYPYPFLDVGAAGLTRVIVNSAGVMAAFGFVALLLWGLDHAKPQRRF